MSVTHTARAVFSSIHKFVFAVLLVTLTQFSYAESDRGKLGSECR